MHAFIWRGDGCVMLQHRCSLLTTSSYFMPFPFAQSASHSHLLRAATITSLHQDWLKPSPHLNMCVQESGLASWSAGDTCRGTVDLTTLEEAAHNTAAKGRTASSSDHFLVDFWGQVCLRPTALLC